MISSLILGVIMWYLLQSCKDAIFSPILGIIMWYIFPSWVLISDISYYPGCKHMISPTILCVFMWYLLLSWLLTLDIPYMIYPLILSFYMGYWDIYSYPGCLHVISTPIIMGVNMWYLLVLWVKTPDVSYYLLLSNIWYPQRSSKIYHSAGLL